MVQSGLDEISERLRPIFEQQRVRRAIVFGSLARGEMSRRSDLDLIVIQDTGKRFLDRYGAFGGIGRQGQGRAGAGIVGRASGGADSKDVVYREAI